VFTISTHHDDARTTTGALKKKVSAGFHSRHFYSATIAAKAYRALLREVEKYPSIVGFEPGILALIANTLTNLAEMTDKVGQGHPQKSLPIVGSLSVPKILALGISIH